MIHHKDMGQWRDYLKPLTWNVRLEGLLYGSYKYMYLCVCVLGLITTYF